jgi:hypothetical protein
MKRFIFLVAIFVVIPFISAAQPKLTFIGGDMYDWGDVRPNQSPLKGTIKVKNEGNENLIITNVKPSCGCTATKLAKDTLKSGETTTVDVSLNVGGGTGVLQKTVLFESNDPDRKKFWYKISCNVIRDLIFKPAQHLAFKEPRVGEEAVATMSVKNNSQKTIRLYELKVAPEGILRVTTPNDVTIPPGEEIPVTAVVIPKEAGYFNVKLIFKTDSPDYPELTIPAYGNAKESDLFNNPNGNKK